MLAVNVKGERCVDKKKIYKTQKFEEIKYGSFETIFMTFTNA